MSIDTLDWERIESLSDLSKNLSGKATITAPTRSFYASLNKYLLKNQIQLNMDVQSGPCDADSEKTLNGTLTISLENIVDENSKRGIHHGYFKWTPKTGNGVWEGNMCGTTNMGTHRELPTTGTRQKPFITDCEPCNVMNHMEGRLLGYFPTLTHVVNNRVFCSYVLSFKNNAATANVPIRSLGTLEGAIVILP